MRGNHISESATLALKSQAESISFATINLSQANSCTVHSACNGQGLATVETLARASHGTDDTAHCYEQRHHHLINIYSGKHFGFATFICQHIRQTISRHTFAIDAHHRPRQFNQAAADRPQPPPTDRNRQSISLHRSCNPLSTTSRRRPTDKPTRC